MRAHNKAAVRVREDMKRMVQLPVLRARAAEVQGGRLFGVSLADLRERGLMEDGVPVAVRRMVEHLCKHALHQEGLFRVNGNVRTVESLKQRLESGEDVDFVSVTDAGAVASLLKLYLRDLPGGLVDPALQPALIKQHQECSDDGSWFDLRDLLQQLPHIHYCLLRYLCHFLTKVESHHKENRMTALNLATVFGPNVFHVSPGFEAMRDQNICNKILAKLIQNYGSIFESNSVKVDSTEEPSTVIIVKEVNLMNVDTKPCTRSPKTTVHKKKSPPDNTDPLSKQGQRKKVRKGKTDNVLQVTPHPGIPAVLPPVTRQPTSVSTPVHTPRSTPVHTLLTTELGMVGKIETTPRPSSPRNASLSMEALNSPQEEDRPISPFYMSNHLSPIHCRPDVENFLDRTIRSVVEQHLFNPDPSEDLSLLDSELTSCPVSPVVTPNARQRRRQQRELQVEALRSCERSRTTSLKTDINKENIPSSVKAHFGAVIDSEATGGQAPQRAQSGQCERTPKPRKSKHIPTLRQLIDNQEAQTECTPMTEAHNTSGSSAKESSLGTNEIPRKHGHAPPQRLRMKIQESPVICDTGRVSNGGGVRGSDPESCEDVPRLDLTALTEDSNWGDRSFFTTPFLDFKSTFQSNDCDEPVPAYSSWQRESMDREEARLSPHAGGRLIRQLMEENSDPMLSPRFYAYGHCQQYLDDTEVPPSPPNAHSFVSRRRSSSLGSCDDEKEELTSAQLSKRIHVLKKKIHRFEERFEEERKYRPSHSDKVANPEVLRWVNELTKLRKDMKEHKLIKSEEDLPPLTRQRSNTLPKSFGSQLEKKPQQEKAPLPPVESTLEVVLSKLQEKREEVGRPEDIKDMTREQIGAEKVALQKALLYYESIHGRPVTKNERQIMKPLYDRYRLVKQILCRASTIPVIGSPSSKRRGPLLQPIIEGVPALFFDDIKEEEDGSEDDGESKPQLSATDSPNLSMLGFLEQLEDEVDGFISPVDELSPSKNTSDMRLSNLHSATMEELVEQLQETREEKKRIRKNLREFEDQFLRQNGRNMQKEDRSPLAVEYNEYKHVKAKLRLLEVLISKREATKFI